MSGETQEIVTICEALPDAQRHEVADFARFLLARLEEDAWENALADSKRRPKLEQFLRETAAEGGEGPMDVNRL